MRIEFDDGTPLLRDASEEVPFAEWDDRVDEYRAQPYRYRALLTGLVPGMALANTEVVTPSSARSSRG